jgi:glycosyltransferase involved in cell wall biosynthesis
MEKKKILILHTKYRITGGEDVAVYNEVKSLKKVFDVETLYFSNQDINSYIKQIKYFLFNNNPEINEKLINKINEFRPDLIYVHNTWFKASLGIFKIIDIYKLRYLVKLHNFRFDCGRYLFKSKHLKNKTVCPACGFSNKETILLNKYFKDSYFKSILLIIYSKKYYKILKKSKLVTLTIFQKNFLVENGFKSDNINVLHNPLLIDNKLESSSFNFEPKSYLIYAGLISSEKGVGVLIDTFKMVSNLEKKLLIVGEGPLLEELKEKNKNNNKIIFLGSLENDEVIALIKNSFSVVSNTSLYEGQPTLLTEASLLNVNSVYPSNGGISEFFPQNNPFEFKSGDNLDLLKKLKLLRHYETVSDQANKNFEFSEKKLNLNKYISSFTKLMKNE